MENTLNNFHLTYECQSSNIQYLIRVFWPHLEAYIHVGLWLVVGRLIYKPTHAREWRSEHVSVIGLLHCKILYSKCTKMAVWSYVFMVKCFSPSNVLYCQMFFTIKCSPLLIVFHYQMFFIVKCPSSNILHHQMPFIGKCPSSNVLGQVLFMVKCSSWWNILSTWAKIVFLWAAVLMKCVRSHCMPVHQSTETIE